jgi:hypothetical protein
MGELTPWRGGGVKGGPGAVARMGRSAIRGSCHDETAPDYASLHPGYGLEATPLPKGCHLSIAGELAALGLLKSFKNGYPVLFRDREDLAFPTPLIFGPV